MKKILVLGAGQSAPYLIHYLLDASQEHDWFVTVGDLDESLAQKRVGSNPRGKSVFFDVNDADLRATLIQNHDVIV